MATWIQSLSWTLIYSLGQGILIYSALWLVLKLVPHTLSNVRYHVSLTALTVLFGWFGTTWWQQYHLLKAGAAVVEFYPVSASVFWHEVQHARAAGLSLYQSAVAYMHLLMPWLAVLYFIGLLLMLVRLSAGLFHLSLLGRSGVAPGEDLYADFTALKRRLQINGNVRISLSARAQVPMVIGFVKPVILMPAAAMAQLSTEQLESILLHELAHIKRHDYLVNILQTVVETILFFNPFAWLVSANIRREREHCCDDLVLDHTREPLSYATALAALAAPPGYVDSFTVAASGQSDHLFNRIKRIMEMKKNQFSYSRVAAAILIVSAITCSVAWLSPSFANPGKDKENGPSRSTTTTTTTTTTKTTTGTATGQPQDVGTQEVNKLVVRMTNDGLINDMDGYWVQKKDNKLILNGAALPDDVAAKYLEGITQSELNIRVFSFKERQQMHPDANILQLLAPTTFQSGCVQYKPKEGC